MYSSRSLNQLFCKCPTEVIDNSWDLTPSSGVIELLWCLSTLLRAGKTQSKHQLSVSFGLVHTGILISVLGYMTKTSFINPARL